MVVAIIMGSKTIEIANCVSKFLKIWRPRSNVRNYISEIFFWDIIYKQPPKKKTSEKYLKGTPKN